MGLAHKLHKCATCDKVGVFQEAQCRWCRKADAAQAANTLAHKRRYWRKKNALRGYGVCVGAGFEYVCRGPALTVYGGDQLCQL